MKTRGGRGWGGDKSTRFMMVGNKDNSSTGAKTGVVAPVPINTPSLRQEIHGSLGDNAAIASINRASAGGGWGSAAGAASASAGNPDEAGGGGKGRGRGGGGARSQGGDDVFTRHFPDLRAGLEQAERLDAVTKASSKVAPLRKPKPEPTKDQGPSLRPRAMLKPTGSAGGGSAATAAAQAAIKDAVHNRVATTLKPEERRRNTPSFADEIGTKSRWTGGRPPSQETGGRGHGGGQGGGGRGGGGAWDTNRDGGRERGSGGLGYDRERGTRGDAFQDKDRRSFTHVPERVYDRGSDRVASNSRGRESIFGAGAHVGMANSNQESTSGGTKALATTYVRQHGPPPRKATTPSASTPVQQEQPSGTQQPTRSAAYSASARSEYASETELLGTSTETSKWRPASPPSTSAADAPDVSPTLDSCSSQSGSYVRTHGPPRRSGREGPGDEQGGGGRGYDASEEGNSRFGGSWGAPEPSRGVVDRDSVGTGERTPSGRWKEPANSLAPPPAPTNTRWKEPKEEPKAGVRRWKGREEGQMGSGRWGRSNCDQDDAGSGNVAHAAQSPPSQGSSWKEEPADDEWGLQAVEHEDEVASSAAVGHVEQQADDTTSQHDEGGAGVAAVAGDSVDAGGASIDDNASPSTTAEGTPPDDPASFRSSFVQQPAAAATTAQPVLRNPSWEPQLPRGADAWSAPGHENQGPVQAGPTSSGGASQPWGGPWGTPGFSLSANSDQGPSTMASFLGNGPGEARKGRYMPPALRNPTPSEGNQGDASTVSSVDQEADNNSKDVSTQDLVLPGAGGGMATVSPGCGTDAKAPLYDQQQAPLEEWQQGGAQASHRAAQDQAAHPVEPELHQRQPIHQSHPVQPAQPLHLHNQPHLDHDYRPSPPATFSSFQSQDRHKHQMQEPALHHHFRTQPYHNQDQPGRATMPEHIHRPHFPPEHPQQRQQFNHVQQPPHQQMHVPKHGMQQQPQQQPQQQQQGQQQGQQQAQAQGQGHQQHSMHAHQQLPPPPLGNQVAHHPRHQPVHAQQRNHHHQQDMGRQTSQSQQQQIHIQQQQQHMQQSSAFMMPSPAIGYADPRGARGGGLGGLPIQMAGSYHEMPQQHQAGMPPPGAYGFQSPETHHKR